MLDKSPLSELVIMAQIDALDMVVLGLLLVGSIAYFTKGTYWAVPKDPYASSYANGSAAKASRTRTILEKWMRLARIV